MKEHIGLCLLICCLLPQVQAQSFADSTRLAGLAGSERLALLTQLVEEQHRDAPPQAIRYGREALRLLQIYPSWSLRQSLLYHKGLAHHNVGQYDSVLVYASLLQAASADDPENSGNAQLLRGRAQTQLGNYEDARNALEQAAITFRALGEDYKVATSLNRIGSTHENQGDYDVALGYYEQALALLENRPSSLTLSSSLVHIGSIYEHKGDYPSALAHYNRALSIREALGDQRSIADAYNSIGGIYWNTGDFDQALRFFEQALAIRENLKDEAHIPQLLHNIGVILSRQGNYEKALSYLKRGAAYDEKSGKKRSLAISYNSIGAAYGRQGNYAESLDYFARGLALREELGDKRGIGIALNNIGYNHRELGQLDEAFSYYQRAFSIREEIGDKRGMASSLHSLGAVAELQGRLDEALTQYTQASRIAEEIGVTGRLAEIVTDISSVQEKRGDLDAALQSINRALTIQKETDDPRGYVTASLQLGKLYAKHNQLGDALHATDEALTIADSIGTLPFVRDAHLQRSTILERQGNFEAALSAHQAYKAAYDSLFNSESQSVIAELQQQFKAREQQQRIDTLESERQNQRLWVITLIAGLTLLVVIAGLLYSRVHLRRRALEALKKARRSEAEQARLRAETAEELARRTQEQAEELRRANDLKSRFLANISHEFRTPLTLTFGPLDDLLNGHFHLDDDARPHIERARRNGSRLLRLINQLLDLSKLDAGALLLRPSRQDLAVQLRQIAGLFESIAITRDIQFLVEIPESSGYKVYDAEKIEKVIVNLLSNAFKFTPSGGKVSLAFEEDAEANATFSIADTGPGIAEEHLPYLFDRFYQVEDATTRSHEGSGIGLSLVKELVELHEGTVTVESTLGFGSRFMVRLPYQEWVAVPDEAELASGDGAAQPKLSDSLIATPMPLAKPEPVPQEATVILVIEDNSDMRAYIRAHLEGMFTVLEAANGRLGLEKACEEIPDLVLSDVMMPEMDGLEVSKALKEDNRTSHIPVVLLTARAQVEHRIQGFEAGADAFLPKPFNAQELQVRVRTLIEERRRLRKRFTDAPDDVPESQTIALAQSAALPSREAAFLKNLDTLIEAHLADSQFGVDALAEALHMSTRQLFRKLKAIIDAKPAVLIRRKRLEHAAALLSTGEVSVKEVCYAVGFQSTSSFSRAFREFHGIPPSSYAERASTM